MSCNGCRVLRKGCSDSCILRPCLQWIEGAEAQGHATVFVAKFFGRAGLMNFISAVPDNQRPALFQSLLYEACGRTVNPVYGAVGLLWSGSWHVCQAAVETVLKGGSLQPIIAALKPAQNLPMMNILAGPPQHFAPNFHSKSPDSVLAEAMKYQQQQQQLQQQQQMMVLPQVCVGDEEGSRLDSRGLWSQQHRRSSSSAKLNHSNKSNQSCSSNEEKNPDRVEAGGVSNVAVKREYPSTELLAPVPRRMRPRQQLLQHCDSSAAGGGNGGGEDGEAIDLDLTLGSHSTSPKLPCVQQQPQHHHYLQQQQQQIVDLKTRVHSPCQSITSEGSVTSVDTADLKISLRQQQQ